MRKKVVIAALSLCLTFGALDGCGDAVTANNSAGSQTAISTDASNSKSAEESTDVEFNEEYYDYQEYVDSSEPEITGPVPIADPHAAWLEEVSGYSVGLAGFFDAAEMSPESLERYSADKSADSRLTILIEADNVDRDDANLGDNLWQFALPNGEYTDPLNYAESSVFAGKAGAVTFLLPVESYDHDNLVVRVTSPDGQCSYEYAVENRCVLRELPYSSYHAEPGVIFSFKSCYYMIRNINITYDSNTDIYNYQLIMTNFMCSSDIPTKYTFDNSVSLKGVLSEPKGFTLDIDVQYRGGQEDVRSLEQYGGYGYDNIIINVSGIINIPEDVEDKEKYISQLESGARSPGLILYFSDIPNTRFDPYGVSLKLGR